MSKLFNELKAGIQDMAKHVRGEHVDGITLKTVSIRPVPEANGRDIKRIRLQLGMSQGALAAILGVSKKTVEAWEAEINIPGKPIARLLQLLTMQTNLVDQLILHETKERPKKRANI